MTHLILALLVTQTCEQPFVGVDQFNLIYNRALRAGWGQKSIGDRTISVGLRLLDTPYVGFTLDQDHDFEFCSVNLNGLDCVTFFESSLGFARMLGKGGNSPKDLVAEVTFTRYRDGKVNGFASRLHYTSDWMMNNAKKGTVKNLSPELPGAVRFTKKINYMSSHPNNYAQLKKHANWVPAIKAMEDQLAKQVLFYVPIKSAAKAERELQDGDIIGITTDVDGLDCAHTGMIWVDESGTRHFVHASSKAKKVVIDLALSEVLKTNSHYTGFMAVRPL